MSKLNHIELESSGTSATDSLTDSDEGTVHVPAPGAGVGLDIQNSRPHQPEDLVQLRVSQSDSDSTEIDLKI